MISLQQTVYSAFSKKLRFVFAMGVFCVFTWVKPAQKSRSCNSNKIIYVGLSGDVKEVEIFPIYFSRLAKKNVVVPHFRYYAFLSKKPGSYSDEKNSIFVSPEADSCDMSKAAEGKWFTVNTDVEVQKKQKHIINYSKLIAPYLSTKTKPDVHLFFNASLHTTLVECATVMEMLAKHSATNNAIFFNLKKRGVHSPKGKKFVNNNLERILENILCIKKKHI